MDPTAITAAVVTITGLAKDLWEVRGKRSDDEARASAERADAEEEARYFNAVSALRRTARQLEPDGLTPTDPDDPAWLYFLLRAQGDGFIEVFQDTIFLPNRLNRSPNSQRYNPGQGY